MRIPHELVTVLSERMPAASAEVHWETGKDVCLRRPLSQETCLSSVQRRLHRLRPRVTGRTLKSGKQEIGARTGRYTGFRRVFCLLFFVCPLLLTLKGLFYCRVLSCFYCTESVCPAAVGQRGITHSEKEWSGVPVFPPGGVFSAGVMPDMPQRCAVKG